jgi:peptide/nickel transport system substrate-binding protein
MSSLLLSGCGGAPVQESGGSILRVGWCSEPDILNPLTSYSTESMQATYLIYETLIGYDTDLNTEYKLAESHELSEDGKTVTYHLKEGVTWQDGEPFSSADVVDTYTRIMEYGLSDAAQYTEFLEEITAPDDNTVVMRFSEPQAFNVAYVAPILPKHIWGDMTAEEIEAFPNDNPNGTGAYKFVEWQQGSILTLERNEAYHGKAPGADKIIYILYGNEDVVVQALKAGEVDVITEVSPTIWDGLNNEENIQAVSLPSFSFHYIGMNCYTDPASLGNKMLLDKQVRQALGYAINREQMVEIALAGHGEIGTSILPSGFDEWKYQFAGDELINNDIAKGNAILDAAGYLDTNGDGIREKDGETMEFRLFAVESSANDVRAAQMFRDMAEQLGIKLVLTTMDENTMGGIIYNVDAADFDIFVWAWDSDYPDPGYLLSVPLTNSIGNNNEVYYSNPEYDALYSLQSTQLDPAERKATINEMEKILYEDCAAQILWYQDKLQAYRTDTFTGWKEAKGGLIYGVTYDNYLNVQPVK